jgi:phage tail-like protein
VTAGEGWLLRQLPRAMAADEVIAGFVLGFEDVAGTVRGRLDGLEHQLDPGLAAPAMLAFVASWLGLQLDTLPADASAARDRHRDLMAVAGHDLRGRGTAEGLRKLLKALTGSVRVEVEDRGGIFFDPADVPADDPTVTVWVGDLGGLTADQVKAFLRQELPVTARLRLLVGRDRAEA